MDVRAAAVCFDRKQSGFISIKQIYHYGLDASDLTGWPSVGWPSCGCRRARCAASGFSRASESRRPSQTEPDSAQGPMAAHCQTGQHIKLRMQSNLKCHPDLKSRSKSVISSAWCVRVCVHTPCACSSTQRWRGPDGKVVGSRVCPPSPWPLSAEPPPEQTSPGWPAPGPGPWWRWSHAATVCQEQVKHTWTWGADRIFLDITWKMFAVRNKLNPY